MKKIVLFIGDEPAIGNLDQDIAFVGTSSYVTLMQWVARLKLHWRQFELYNKDSFPLDEEQFIYVALGHKAHAELEMLGIEHFYLPHPSGANHLLNNKKWVYAQLKECRQWLGLSS